jgi:CotS family spore coat protein
MKLVFWRDSVREREQGVIEQYDLLVTGSRKGRGVTIYETDAKTYVLKAVKGSQARMSAQAQILEQLMENGEFSLERYVPNREGAYLTKNEEGEQFLLKEYLEGREWNLEDEMEILRGSRILGALHTRLVFPQKLALPEAACWSREVDKHSRELKRTRNFIRQRQQKNEFERLYLKLYPEFYRQAEGVQKRLEDFAEAALFRESVERGCLCHGDFTYHNLIHYRGGAAILNFDKLHYGIQMEDFYQYFRKVMEKNDWRPPLAEKVLGAYMEKRPVNRMEREYLALRFAYPDKFWKVANHYFNGSKNRIIEKGQDKLETLQRQNEKRKEFLVFLDVWSKMC